MTENMGVPWEMLAELDEEQQNQWLASALIYASNPLLVEIGLFDAFLASLKTAVEETPEVFATWAGEARAQNINLAQGCGNPTCPGGKSCPTTSLNMLYEEMAKAASEDSPRNSAFELALNTAVQFELMLGMKTGSQFLHNIMFSIEEEYAAKENLEQPGAKLIH